MEDTTNPAPTDAADAGASSEPEPAAQTAPADERKGLASFEEALRSSSVPVKADANGDGGSPTGAGDGPDDGKPASEQPPASDDATPEQQQPGQGGRRSRNAEQDKARIADLERQLAERDPEKIREQVLKDARAQFEAEQQRDAEQATEAAEAEKYEQLRDRPDRDLSDDDYRWREEYKARLGAFPKARAAYRAEADRRFAALKEKHDGEVSTFWRGIHDRFGLLQTLDGVSVDALRGTDLLEIGRHLYDTGGDTRESKVRAELQPKLDKALDEVRRLKAEASQFRLTGRGGLAAARAPQAGGGRTGSSNGGRPDWKASTSSDFFAAALRESEDRSFDE